MPEQRTIPHDGGRALGGFEPQVDALGAGSGPHRLHRLDENQAKPARFLADADAGLYPAQVQKITHQAVHLLDALQDPLHIVALPLVELAHHRQHRRISPHEGQRSPQVVGDRGHELGLELVQLLKMGDVPHHDDDTYREPVAVLDGRDTGIEGAAIL